MRLSTQFVDTTKYHEERSSVQSKQCDEGTNQRLHAFIVRVRMYFTFKTHKLYRGEYDTYVSIVSHTSIVSLYSW